MVLTPTTDQFIFAPIRIWANRPTEGSFVHRTLRLLTCFILPLLMSCSSTEWIHRYKHPDQFAKDQAKCEEQVRNRPTMQITSPYKTNRAIEVCLKKLGWVQRDKRRT